MWDWIICPLSRATVPPFGGEAQRIRLATQIGSGLVRGAYITLDEPSIGLHQRDNDKLLKTLEHLRDLRKQCDRRVEHDEDTIRAADCIVDIGQGPREHNGNVVAVGTAAQIMKCKRIRSPVRIAAGSKFGCRREERNPQAGSKSVREGE